MTEAEWLVCTDSSAMVCFLHRKARRGKQWASDRKYRLFFCARCRKEWKALTDKRSRRAVDIAERFADGLVDTAKLKDAEEAAKAATADAFAGKDVDAQNASLLAHWSTYPDSERRACEEVGCADDYDCWWEEQAADFPDPKATSRQLAILQIARKLERGHHAELLHDLLGNPFRPIRINKPWLTPKVVTLAQTMYKRRVFERMKDLGDSLEEVGCKEKGVLDHCRQPGAVHVRGCWVVDLVLGKK